MTALPSLVALLAGCAFDPPPFPDAAAAAPDAASPSDGPTDLPVAVEAGVGDGESAVDSAAAAEAGADLAAPDLAADSPPRAPEQLTWGPPGTILTGVAPSHPHLASDGAGNAAVVWLHDRGNLMTEVWWNRRRAGADWEKPERLQEDLTHPGYFGRSSRPVAVTDQGEAYVGWFEAGTPSRTVLRHFSERSGWGPARYLTGHGEPSMGAYPGGGLAVLCSAGRLHYSRHERTKGWSDPEMIVQSCMMPNVAMNREGAALVANDLPRLAPARYTPAAGWSVPPLGLVAMFFPPFAVMRTDVAINSAGEALVSWATPEAPGMSIWIAAISGAGQWERPQRIQQGNAHPSANVALSDSRAAVVVWSSTGMDGTAILAARRDAAGWGAPERIGTGNFTSRGPAVALDPRGYGVAVWARNEGDPSMPEASIWAARLLPAAGWQAAQRIGDAPPALYLEPSAVLDAGGTGIAVWPAGSFLRWSALQ